MTPEEVDGWLRAAPEEEEAATEWERLQAEARKRLAEYQADAIMDMARRVAADRAAREAEG